MASIEGGRHPRLASARQIVAKAGVTADPGGSRWLVAGSLDRASLVDEIGGRFRCTCRWDAEFAGSRGPCKHILAVLISLRGA